MKYCNGFKHPDFKNIVFALQFFEAIVKKGTSISLLTIVENIADTTYNAEIKIIAEKIRRSRNCFCA